MIRDTEDLRIAVLCRNHEHAVYERQQQQIAEHRQFITVYQSRRTHQGETPAHQQAAGPDAPQNHNSEIHDSGGSEDVDFNGGSVHDKKLWTPDQQCRNPESLHSGAVTSETEQTTELKTENDEPVTPPKYDAAIKLGTGCIAVRQRMLREESDVLKATLARTQSELGRHQLEWQEERTSLKQSLSDIQHSMDDKEKTLETRMNLLAETIAILTQQMNKPKKRSVWQRFKALFKRP